MEKQQFMYDRYVRMELAEKTSNPENIDKWTLEIMCNKKKYNKLLSKTNPALFEERREHFAKVQTYSSRILSLTEQMLGSPDTLVSNDIQEVFDPFVHACIRYLERKDYEEKISSKDEEVLFGNMEEREDQPLYTSTSFWGKSIKKLYPPKG